MTKRHSRRVLIVTAYAPPTGGGGTIRIAKLARHLAPLGWTADIIGWADAPSAVDDPSLLAELPSDASVQRVSTPLRRLEASLGSRERRRSGPRTRRFRVLSGMQSAVHALIAIPDPWIGWALRVASLPRGRLAAGRPIDAVLSSGPPHSAHLAGLLLSRRLRVPLLMDLRDEWASNPQFRSRFAARRRVDEALERACVRAAAAVVTVSEVSAGRYRARYPSRAGRIHVIPNGFDPADLEALPAREAAGPDEPIVLGHVGSLRAPRDVRPLLGAIERLRAAGGGPPIRLLLAGDVDADQLDAARAVLGDAVGAPGHIAHHEAVRVMAACDVLLVLSHRGEAGPASLTGKIYEELALRRPILAITPEGPGSRLVDDSNAGAWADPDDQPAIERALRRTLDLARDPAFNGAPDHLVARFDRRLQAAAWRDVLERAAVRGARVHRP